jgi:Tfp pilus assembly protein PilF
VGIALADQHDAAAALEEFQRAVTLEPDSAVAHYNMGGYLYDLHRYEEAKPELETACRLARNYTQAMLSLAMNRRKLGESAAAARLLAEVLRLEPANAEAQLQMGQVEVELDQEQSGINHLKRAVELDPKNSQ